MPRVTSELVGSWRLVSREDRTAGGELRVDPVLGPDPIAFLVFDNAGNFATQLMKRDRTDTSPRVTRRAAGNNTGAGGGYDAYFGHYEVDPNSDTVSLRLVGALSSADVGRVVSRNIRVDGDRLTISLDTTTVEGEPVTRTLVWQRADRLA